MRLAAKKTVTVTAASCSLADLGVTLKAGLKKLTLLPAGTVRWEMDEAATGSSSALPSTPGIVLDIDQAGAAKLRFYAASVAMDVLQSVGWTQ